MAQKPPSTNPARAVFVVCHHGLPTAMPQHSPLETGLNSGSRCKVYHRSPENAATATSVMVNCASIWVVANCCQTCSPRPGARGCTMVGCGGKPTAGPGETIWARDTHIRATFVPERAENCGLQRSPTGNTNSLLHGRVHVDPLPETT